MVATAVHGRRGTHRRAAVTAVLITMLLGCAAPAGPDTSPTGTPNSDAGPSTRPEPTPSPALPTATASPTPSPSPAPPPAPAPAPAPAPVPAPAPAPAPPKPVPSPPTTVPAAWQGIDVEVLPTSRKVVALTFDGGGSDAGVASILDTLGRYGTPATFFVTGQFARTYPDAVRAIAAAGHPVGNHSDTHPDFTVTTTAEINRQLADAETAISALTGRAARPLFRFPYGARTPLDVRVVNDAGYIPFRWTVDTLGWKGTSGGIDASQVQQRVLETAAPGQIVLMHVGANPDDASTLDADALPGIIEALTTRGYGFVDLLEATRSP